MWKKRLTLKGRDNDKVNDLGLLKARKTSQWRGNGQLTSLRLFEHKEYRPSCWINQHYPHPPLQKRDNRLSIEEKTSFSSPVRYCTALKAFLNKSYGLMQKMHVHKTEENHQCRWKSYVPGIRFCDHWANKLFSLFHNSLLPERLSTEPCSVGSLLHLWKSAVSKTPPQIQQHIDFILFPPSFDASSASLGLAEFIHRASLHFYLSHWLLLLQSHQFPSRWSVSEEIAERVWSDRHPDRTTPEDLSLSSTTIR